MEPSVKVFMEASVEVVSVEVASVKLPWKLFMEAPVKMPSVEASVEIASLEAFVEASVGVAPV